MKREVILAAEHVATSGAVLTWHEGKGWRRRTSLFAPYEFGSGAGGEQDARRRSGIYTDG
jgi:hypothetical protein